MRPSLDDSSRRSNQEAEEFLKQHESYIRIQAWKEVRGRRGMVNPDVLDLEADEMAQQLRIKVWLAWRKTNIVNPKAYISRMAHNESVSIRRQYKPTCPLVVDEDGELYQGQMTSRSQWMDDPLDEVEQKETTTHFFNELVNAVVALPALQQRAMLCSLKDRVDDTRPLEDACQEHHIDLDALHWATASDELQSMRTSVSIARKKLRAMVEAS